MPVASRSGLSSAQLALLDVAVAATGLTRGTFVERVLRGMPGVSAIEDLDGSRFDMVMDCLVAIGFRHPAVPILSAAQLACLDAARRRIGMPGRDYVALLRHATDVQHRWQMTGTHFLALTAVFESCGVADPLPEPGFVDQPRAAVLRRLAWRAGVPEGEFRDLLLKFGGTGRLRGLDRRAYNRIQFCLHRRGATLPPAPPRALARPGMATQAQVNLLWKRWHDLGGAAGDLSDGAFERAIEHQLGLPGGVETLTRAGARRVLEAWSE